MPANPIMQVAEIAESLFFKIKEVLSTAIGWAMMGMTFMFTVFGDKAMLIHWILLALFIDLFFGCWSSAKMSKFHISYALTSTAIKLVMYVTLFYMPLIIDKIVPGDLSYLTVLVTVVLCSAEFFSALAHMLIIKPDLIGAKLVKKMLIGEISRKTGLPVAEVEKLFNISKS
ncbi:MAG: phage holin family protein [Parachlamydiaceae bacterium]